MLQARTGTKLTKKKSGRNNLAGKVGRISGAIRNPSGPITQAVGSGSRDGQWPTQPTEEIKVRIWWIKVSEIG